MWDKFLSDFGSGLHPGGELLTKKIILGSETLSGKALDIGCGTGTSCALLSESGFEAFGIDSDAGFVQKARLTACSAEIIQGDMNLLPYEDSFFDLVLCECVLSTLSDKEKPLMEMQRVLKAGGRLAWSDLCSKNDDGSWSLSDWSSVVRASGFINISIFSADEEWRAFAAKILWSGADLRDFAACLCLGIPAKDMSYCYGFAQKSV